MERAKKQPVAFQQPAAVMSGERGIRTPGTVIPYGSLANCWFKPLTHLTKWDDKGNSNLPFHQIYLDTMLFNFHIGANKFIADFSYFCLD